MFDYSEDDLFDENTYMVGYSVVPAKVLNSLPSDQADLVDAYHETVEDIENVDNLNDDDWI